MKIGDLVQVKNYGAFNGFVGTVFKIRSPQYIYVKFAENLDCSFNEKELVLMTHKSDKYRDRKRKSLTIPDDWQELIEKARNALESRNVDTSTHRKGSDALSESAVVEAALRWIVEQHGK